METLHQGAQAARQYCRSVDISFFFSQQAVPVGSCNPSRDASVRHPTRVFRRNEVARIEGRIAEQLDPRPSAGNRRETGDRVGTV
jgi:hypothetical protein